MKPVVLIMIVALVGGLIVGAGMMGIIDIPGLSPAKKKAGAQAAYGSDKEKEAAAKDAATKEAKAKEKAAADAKAKAAQAAAKKAKPPAPIVSVSKDDPEAGRKKVAKLWNELTPEVLMPIIAKGWKDDELAEIFVKMDSGKVAILLAALKPDQASKLTKAIQKVSSKPVSK